MVEYHEVDLEWEKGLNVRYLSNEEREELDRIHGRINRKDDDQVELISHSDSLAICRVLYIGGPSPIAELKNEARDLIDYIRTSINSTRAFYKRSPATDIELNDAYKFLRERGYIHEDTGENGCGLTDYGREVVGPLFCTFDDPSKE